MNTTKLRVVTKLLRTDRTKVSDVRQKGNNLKRFEMIDFGTTYALLEKSGSL